MSDQKLADDLTELEARRAALGNMILAVDEQIAKAQAARSRAEAEESAERERLQLASVRAGREQAQTDFNCEWEEAHASLLAHVEQLAQHRARFAAASRELGVRADIRPPGMLLNHSLLTALDALTSAQEREAQADRYAGPSLR